MYEDQFVHATNDSDTDTDDGGDGVGKEAYKRDLTGIDITTLSPFKDFASSSPTDQDGNVYISEQPFGIAIPETCTTDIYKGADANTNRLTLH